MKYKFLPHTADIKFQAFGDSLENVFENASYALKDIITKDKIKAVIKQKIRVAGNDNESLLLNFLEEFLFLFETKSFVLSKVEKIEIKNNKLVAEVIGDNKKYELGNHIKAITYNEMFVKLDKGKWVCQVVVDV